MSLSSILADWWNHSRLNPDRIEVITHTFGPETHTEGYAPLTYFRDRFCRDFNRSRSSTEALAMIAPGMYANDVQLYYSHIDKENKRKIKKYLAKTS